MVSYHILRWVNVQRKAKAFIFLHVGYFKIQCKSQMRVCDKKNCCLWRDNKKLVLLIYPFIHLFLKSYIHSIFHSFMDLPKSLTVDVNWCQVIGPMQSIFFHMYRKNVILHQNLDSVKSKLLCIYENYYRFSSMSSVEMVLGESD